MWETRHPTPFGGAPRDAPWIVYVANNRLGRRPMSLCLYGPSRTGKTTWARSLGAHVYFERLMSGKVALDNVADAEYAVFDDCSITHTPGWKSWFGAQAVIGIRALYRDTQYVNWNKPIIWCANRDPRIDMQNDVNDERRHNFFQDDIDWINANCIFIYVGETIATFHASTE